MSSDPFAEPRLAAEVEELRRAVRQLEARLGRTVGLELRADRERPYLGQPVTLTTRLVDSEDRPLRRAQPVTFTTTLGLLQTTDGFEVRQGASVTTTTYPDGSARVRLLPPAAEGLTAVQQDALTAMLTRLDPRAEAPTAVVETLQALVRQYRWQAAVAFRQAVDLLFRGLAGERVERLNRRDELARWRHLEATVTASAVAAGGGVLAGAIRTVRLVDWLTPWLTVYLRLARDDDDLDTGLREVRVGAGGDAGRLLEEAYRRVDRFVERQPGELGRRLGRRAARGALRRLLETGLDDLPTAAHQPVLTGLRIASQAVGEAGTAVLSGLGEMSRVTRRDAAERTAGLGASLRAALEGVRGELGAKADLDALESFEEETRTQLGRKVNVGTFNGFRNQTRQQLEAKADQQTFTTFQQETRASLAQKLEATAFSTFRNRINQNLTRLRTRVPGFTPVPVIGIGILRRGG